MPDSSEELFVSRRAPAERTDFGDFMEAERLAVRAEVCVRFIEMRRPVWVRDSLGDGPVPAPHSQGGLGLAMFTIKDDFEPLPVFAKTRACGGTSVLHMGWPFRGTAAVSSPSAPYSALAHLYAGVGYVSSRAPIVGLARKFRRRSAQYRARRRALARSHRRAARRIRRRSH